MTETLKWLNGQLASVKQERDEYMANVHRCTGAIVAFELVLKELSKPEDTLVDQPSA